MKKVIFVLLATLVMFPSMAKNNGWCSKNHMLDITMGVGQNFLFSSELGYYYKGDIQDFTNFTTWNISCAFFSYDFGIKAVYAGDVLGYPRFNYTYFERVSITPYDFEFNEFQVSPFVGYEWTSTGTEDTSENTIGWERSDYVDYSNYASHAPKVSSICGGVQIRWFVSSIISLNTRFSISKDSFGSVFSASLWF